MIEEEPVPRGDVMSYRPVIRGIDEDDEPTPARLAADARLEHVVAGLTFGFLLLVPALAFLTNGAATADRTAFALGMVALALAAVVVVAAGLAALRR